MNPTRIRSVNDVAVREDREIVLYWMTACRRPRYNYALDRACEHAVNLGKPVVVLEALRSGYRWASDRLHRFVLDGMVDNLAAFEASGVGYFPYVEERAGAGSGLLEALAERAAVVVTDDYPCFFVPRMLAAAGKSLERAGVALEAVDGNGLYPMWDTDRAFQRAFDFRRHLQRRLPELFEDPPGSEPPAASQLPGGRYEMPADILARWPMASREKLESSEWLSQLEIDHDVAPVSMRGGERAGRERLERFLARLDGYGERSHPDGDGGSGLSPYLHFGHVSAQEVFQRVADQEGWSPDRIADHARGSRTGWWGMSAEAESFLDELVTWRELGFNACVHLDDYDRYESLPEWARETLAAHESDRRPYLYTLAELEQARTHDPIWNAAQRELLRDGRMHNYMRMLWGKKILEWTVTPRVALAVMIELNNKYAVDGRDPSSYNGIFWVLGRYDRPWGPERPVFGKIRYMSSESTIRKLRLRRYLDRYGERSTNGGLGGDQPDQAMLDFALPVRAFS